MSDNKPVKKKRTKKKVTAKKSSTRKSGRKGVKTSPPIADIDRPLTMKQEAWCQWMTSALVNFNGAEAARRAGYSGTDMQMSRVSWGNKKKANVAKRLKQLTDIALSGANITIEKVLRDLEVQRCKALEAGQYAAANQSSMLQGKWLKMFVDRIEQVQTLDDMSTDELVRLFNEIAESGNIDINKLLTQHGSSDGDGADPAVDQTTH